MYSVNIGVNLQMGWVVRETMIIIMTRTPQKIFGKNLKRCRDELAKKGWRQGRDGWYRDQHKKINKRRGKLVKKGWRPGRDGWCHDHKRVKRLIHRSKGKDGACSRMTTCPTVHKSHPHKYPYMWCFKIDSVVSVVVIGFQMQSDWLVIVNSAFLKGAFLPSEFVIELHKDA